MPLVDRYLLLMSQSLLIDASIQILQLIKSTVFTPIFDRISAGQNFDLG